MSFEAVEEPAETLCESHDRRLFQSSSLPLLEPRKREIACPDRQRDDGSPSERSRVFVEQLARDEVDQ